MHATAREAAESQSQPPSRLPARVSSVLAIQRSAGNRAVGRLLAGPEGAKPATSHEAGGPGALGSLARLAALSPSRFGEGLSAAGVALREGLAGDRAASGVPAPTASTGLAPGAAVIVPAAPVPAAAPPTPAAGQAGDAAAADEYAAGGAAALDRASGEATAPAPALGQSLAPTVETGPLPRLELPAAGGLAQAPATPAPGDEREAAALDAASGSEVRRLVGGLLGPATAAGAAHAAQVVRAHAAEAEVARLQTETEARQRSVRTESDEGALREHADWTARRQDIVDASTAEIRSAASATKADVTQTARAAEAEAATDHVAGQGVGTYGGGLWDRVSRGASAAVGAAGRAVSAVGAAAGNFLAAARAKIGGLLNQLAGAIRRRVSSAVEALRAGALRTWAAIRTAYTRAQQAVTALAQAAKSAASRLWSTVTTALAGTWQRVVAAARSAWSAATDIARRVGVALGKVREVLKLLDSPLLKFLLEIARDAKATVVDPLVAKAAPHSGAVPGMAADVVGQQKAAPGSEPKLPLQRQATSAARPAGDFSVTASRQMSEDAAYFLQHWSALLAQVIWNVLWPVYLFTEELPGLVEECKGVFSPAPGLDRLDHVLGVARRLVNTINGTLATLGVWAGILALLGGPVAEFFTVGTYYAVSLVMIQVDIGVALAQLVKDWYSGSRPGINQDVQSRYAKMYSSTAVGAIVTAALVVLGIVAARFGAKLKASLPKEPVKPVEPAEKPPAPVEDKPPTVTPRPATASAHWSGKPCPPDFGNYSGFHGSDTPPEVVKANGGFGKGKNTDLKSHMLGTSAGDDAFMGTTSSAGGGHEGGGSSAWGTYIYEIDGVEAWDCNRQHFMNEGVESPTRGETEIAVRRDVPWEKVKGWYEPREHFSGRQIIGERTDNPDFGKVPSKK